MTKSVEQLRQAPMFRRERARVDAIDALLQDPWILDVPTLVLADDVAGRFECDTRTAIQAIFRARKIVNGWSEALR